MMRLPTVMAIRLLQKMLRSGNLHLQLHEKVPFKIPNASVDFGHLQDEKFHLEKIYSYPRRQKGNLRVTSKPADADGPTLHRDSRESARSPQPSGA